ncbi:hypothetical protein PCANB_000278 [Pneumocystis canis]|nr:hypothetical protein PCK1_000381 [Pneumocystis canis]KAG5437932.1 hypothetical protein PCANB_000278 [Pneumocystis canis]
MKNKEIRKSWNNLYKKRQSLPLEWLEKDIYGTIYRDYAYPSHDIRFHKSPLEYDFLKNTLDSYTELPLMDQKPDFNEDLLLRDDYSHPLLENKQYINDANPYKYMEISVDEIYGKAFALFDFVPEHENEFALVRGQQIWISYRHEQGWLVAVDPETGDTGLVPEEYVHIYDSDNIFNNEIMKRCISINQGKKITMENISQKDQTKDNDFDKNLNINNIMENETNSLNFMYSQLNLQDKNK